MMIPPLRKTLNVPDQESPWDFHERPAVEGSPADAASQQGSSQTVSFLRKQIRKLELGKSGVSESEEGNSAISSGSPAVDRMLPAGGYSRGTLVEWLVPGDSGQTAGSGADILALQLAQRAMQDGGHLVVVDPAEEFYAPAARAFGIPLERTIILRSRVLNDLYWSIDQALRCPAVSAVWCAATPAFPELLVNLNERWHRRFQLAAETGQTLGLLIRPLSVARQPSWSDIQWRVLTPDCWGVAASRRSSRSFASIGWEYDYLRPISLQLVKCRGATSGQIVHLHWDTRTGLLSGNVSRSMRSAGRPDPVHVAIPTHHHRTG